MIDGKGDIHHRTDAEQLTSASLADDHTLLHLSRSKDGSLPMRENDWSSQQAAADTVVGESEGSVLHVRLGELAAASFGREFTETI